MPCAVRNTNPREGGKEEGKEGGREEEKRKGRKEGGTEGGREGPHGQEGNHHSQGVTRARESPGHLVGRRACLSSSSRPPASNTLSTSMFSASTVPFTTDVRPKSLLKTAHGGGIRVSSTVAVARGWFAVVWEHVD